MKSSFKILLASTIAPVAMLAAAGAHAQTVAVADLDAAANNSKAYVAAVASIKTTFKPLLDQAETRGAAIQKELEPLIAAIDTNKDGQLTQAEVETAQRANRPEFASIQQKQAAGTQEISRIEGPAVRAQQYAREQVFARLRPALQAAITKRGVQMLVKPDALLFAQPAADLTGAITAEIDAALPSVSITPPVGWQPGQAQAAPGAAPGTPTTAPAAPRKGDKPR